MGVRRVTGGNPTVLGVESLNRWQEWISSPGYGLGSYGTAWTGLGWSRSMPGSFNAGNVTAIWRSQGSISAFNRTLPGFGLVIEFLPAAAAAGAREVFYHFTIVPAAVWPLDFFPTLPPQVAAAPGVPPTLACSVSAWVRKRIAGDQPGARQMPIGFVNLQDFNFSRRIARIGLHGNGAGGFRFCSENCPSAPAGAVENGQTDTDANSVSPAILAAPGTNWFHVRVKMCSASETQTGRFLCYVNGTLVATFANANNFPRSSRTAADVAEADYWAISPAMACWGNPDGVTVDPGFYIRDLRVRMEEDQAA